MQRTWGKVTSSVLSGSGKQSIVRSLSQPTSINQSDALCTGTGSIVRSLTDMKARPVSDSSHEMKPAYLPPTGHMHMSRGKTYPDCLTLLAEPLQDSVRHQRGLDEKKNTRTLKLNALLVMPDYSASAVQDQVQAGPLRSVLKIYNQRNKRMLKADRKDLRFYNNEELLEICLNERISAPPCPWWVLRFYTEFDYYTLQNELLMDATF